MDDGDLGAEELRARLVLGLRSNGVNDPKVLSALEKTPRDLFGTGCSRSGPGADIRRRC